MWCLYRQFLSVVENCIADIQRCAREGGVWDESRLAPGAPIGGLCISAQEAQQFMASHSRFLQELHVTLSSDGHLDAFEGGLPGNQTIIRCTLQA